LHSISPEVYVFVLILAAFLFWPLWWLASKFFKRTRNIVLASVLGSLVVAPFLYVGLIMAMLFSMHHYPSRTFSAEAWHAGRQAPGDEVFTTRYEYSKDLIDRKLLIGKTKEEVIVMLGEGHETNNRVSYNLGFVPGHGIDPDFLEVYFENGVVVKVEQRRS
jgi:hypothetical protein